ncbi:MAG: response regulator transcription factor [Wenzhouxiangellaceae bacterium]|nr:response regulator transcription factor [Wenzhouxiangellaceae bacterium]
MPAIASIAAPEKLVVVDDHPLFREALSGSIRARLEHCEVLEVASFEGLQALLVEHSDIDLVLLDLHLPGSHGLSGLAWLRGHYPALPVILISGHDDPDIVRRALADGAAGFLSKSSESAIIIEAIGRVIAGETWVPEGMSARAHHDPDETELARRVGELTPQQYRILLMLGEGLLNKQIAWELDITEATVKAHMTAIMRKLGVNNRTQAVTLFNRLNVGRQDIDAG